MSTKILFDVNFVMSVLIISAKSTGKTEFFVCSRPRGWTLPTKKHLFEFTIHSKCTMVRELIRAEKVSSTWLTPILAVPFSRDLNKKQIKATESSVSQLSIVDEIAIRMISSLIASDRWCWILIFGMHAFSVCRIDISFNRPRFLANASWDPHGTTFADSNVIGNEPYGVFVDKNKNTYGLDYSNNRVQVWLNGSSTPTRTISGGLASGEGVFVTSNGDIYVDNGCSNGRVDKWALNETSGTRVMDVSAACSGLFVDINNTLYCSMWDQHQVIKTPLNVGLYSGVTAAGTGTHGASANMLNGPVGIFIDFNFDLYVTDSQNNRVQKFQLGQVNAITVMGTGASITSPLHFPRSVVLDADGNLFVADSQNHRIVTLGPNGFRCIIACSGGSSSSSVDLSEPGAIAFDTCGNIFVVDIYNNRIQKFFLLSNSCGKPSLWGVLTGIVAITSPFSVPRDASDSRSRTNLWRDALHLRLIDDRDVNNECHHPSPNNHKKRRYILFFAGYFDDSSTYFWL